jgi:ATP-binding cassette subfamily A (ABC1) protein 3
MGDCILMMMVNAVIFMFLALYIEGVWPGEYGVPLPWNFPFTVWAKLSFIPCIPTGNNVQTSRMHIFELQKWYWTNGVRNSEADRPAPSIEVKTHLFQAEPDGKAGVQIVGLSKNFSDKWAVQDMHLNMYENQITALLGHNGAGKTTTMSMLTGLFPSTSGTAYINGFDISTDIQSVRARYSIARYALFLNHHYWQNV